MDTNPNYAEMDSATYTALPVETRYEAEYDYLYACHAFDTWQFPDGPWGWNPDGTSKAPNAFYRACHVAWYHDMREQHGE